MPTILTHLAVPLAVRAATGRETISRRLLVAGGLASVLPDFDAIGYFAGVPYESLLGHRGLTHSLAFALLLACLASVFSRRLDARRGWAFAFVFLSAASHGLLDALTDGGLGVAFLSPFSNERFFLPWQPIPVSPIGVREIFSRYGIHLFAAEIALVWLPCLLAALVARGAKRFGRGRALAIALLFAVAYGAGAGLFLRKQKALTSDVERALQRKAMQDEASAHLERQVEKLAARDAASCPQDFAALEGEDTLRISLFHGYDEHEGKVYDRVNSRALVRVLTAPCRGGLAACEFSVVSRSLSATHLARTVRGRRVEIHLFTTSLPERLRKRLGAAGSYLEQERRSGEVRERFYTELVASDVVFYMGHSRLGGSLGFDDQTGATTLLNAVVRRPMTPVLEALRRRPTKLRILGMFSCSSRQYFGRIFEEANPSLSLILTLGELRYGPGEQTSLGALEGVLSQYCGHAFHDSMIAASDPEPGMTRLYRGKRPSPPMSAPQGEGAELEAGGEE